MGVPTPDDSGLVIGTVLAGRYRIAGVLGVGGMGRVYRGVHTAIGKPVAVKVLRRALGRDREAAARFHREAIASGQLCHPNIVSVVDFGLLEDGCAYMVMEALDGEHLGVRLARNGRIPWVDAVMIVRGALLALHHAHERGVVHRDVKPDNIFLADKAGGTVVKLLDFGIAKLYASVAEDQLETRDGIAIGTPTYLSPEQAIGGEITPASDVYSTCVVLYELLVGRAPFESHDPLTLLQAHIGGDVPSFHELAPGLRIPEGIESLVRKGLAKRACERIDSAELVKALDEILREHGIDVEPPLFARASRPTGFPLATPAAGITRARASRSRRRSPSLGSLVVVTLMIVGAIVGLSAYLAQGDGEHVVASSPPKPASSPTDHERQLATALHDLEDGLSCTVRKNAIAKLVELRDPRAVPALKKARLQTKLNACLRVAADQALSTLEAHE